MSYSKDELRNICKRLFTPKTLDDCDDLLNIYAECLFSFIESQVPNGETQVSRHEAKLVNQMIFTKVLSLKKMLEGINYISTSGIKLNTIIDPTIIATMIRNIYETVSMFNIVYIQPKTDDEKLILYNLWVHSGLSFRQRFKNNAISGENIQKVSDELKHIEDIKKEIHNTELYKSLTDENKKKIEDNLKNKDYKIVFDREVILTF